jgi:tyrosine-protein phosphatase YwqE
MFNLFFNTHYKTLTEIDIHSHLIPGIDDGAVDMDTSIKLIEELYLLGYRKLITIPHISDMFPNSKKSILKGYHALKKEVLKRDINMEIEVGAEYYIDESFEKLLESEQLLSFGKKNYLLFEFSYFTPPHDIDNLIYDMILNGYTPVLAHPERYLYWHHNFYKYKELKEMGVLFQININSISGHYNKDIQNIVEQLIKAGMVNFIGSDVHHMAHIKSLKKSFSLSLYKKTFKYNTILNKTL